MSEYLPIQKCGGFDWRQTVHLTFGAELIPCSMDDIQLLLTLEEEVANSPAQFLTDFAE